jgi:glycosyltransferase involved in cell wall biosynthesis
MNILYCSCHETLELDELAVLDKLGHTVFSIGHYTEINNPSHPTRKEKLNIKDNSHFLEAFKHYHNWEKFQARFSDFSIQKVLSSYFNKIHKDFAAMFDLIVIAHFEENLTINWESIKNKPIIIRAIGQPSVHFSEYLTKPNVKRVAYSNTEHIISRYKKFDAIIHPYVEQDYCWEGDGDFLLTINKWFKIRGEGSLFSVYNSVTSGIPKVLAGFGNDDLEYALSDVSPDDMYNLKKNCKAYFSTCTKPGPFTYSFLEALAAGCPMITVGPQLGSVSPLAQTYEAHKYITNGESGFWSDNINEIREYIKLVMSDEKLARKISIGGHKIIADHFSLEKSMKNWEELLRKI